MAQAQGIDFVVRIHQCDADTVYTDERRLKQILFNFCMNAFKHTKNGFITLLVQPSTPKYVNFGVIDTGIGISENDVQFLWE